MNHLEQDNNLRLSLLSIDHLEQVLQLERLCFDSPWSRETYTAEFTENNLAHYCGIWQRETLLAFGGFWQILDEGHIANIGVHPDARGLGLGRLLITRMITECQALGGCRMTLEVRENNTAARKLYEAMGFTNAGIRPHYYENGENAVIMWLELAE